MADNNRFLWGLGLGVVAGLIIAPRSGAKTRALIANSAREGQDFIKQQTAAARDAANEIVERGTKAVKQTTDGIAEAFEAGKRTIVG